MAPSDVIPEVIPQDDAVARRDVVLVTGPWLAGTTSVAAALRRRLPELTFVEADELASCEAPQCVVFVVSAVAPMTASDCGLLDAAAARTDLVIGVVSKIDVHWSWRDVMAADSAAAAGHDSRYRDMPWVGAAAAPGFGDPLVDDLVDALQRGLAEPALYHRNHLRASHFQLTTLARRHEDEAAGVGRDARVAALTQRRGEAIRQHQRARSERTIVLRSRIQQARVQLGYFARNRCMSVRGELQDDASELTRRGVPAFTDYVRKRVDEVVGEVNAGVDKHLGDLAAEFGLTLASGEPPAAPSVSNPPLKKRGLETRLMVLLGAGFGFGVALTLSRLFADLAPAYKTAALIAGAAVGLAVALWVVVTRSVLHDRAVLDRWVSEVVSELQAVVEQHVAARVLQAEPVFTTQQAELDDADAARVADRVATIDGELREHRAAAARAVAVRDRESPKLQRALEAIQVELAANGPADIADKHN